MMKSGLRGVGHRAYTREKHNANRIWMGRSDKKTPFQELWLYMEIYENASYNKQDRRVWTGFIWLRRGTSGKILHT
jgi:hypothetical protein